MNRLGARLKAHRNNAKLEQTDLAKLAGISQATYSRFENGKSTPNLSHLLLIAEALNIRVEALIGREDQEQRVLCSARTDGAESDMPVMKARLLEYMELRAYLKEMGY